MLPSDIIELIWAFVRKDMRVRQRSHAMQKQIAWRDVHAEIRAPRWWHAFQYEFQNCRQTGGDGAEVICKGDIEAGPRAVHRAGVDYYV